MKTKKKKAKGPTKPCTDGKAERPEKIELFCLEYIKDENGARAARDAGWSETGASVTACQLLAKPNVKARIDQLRKERNERVLLSGDEILQEIKKLATSDIRRLINPKTQCFLPTSEWPDDIAVCVSSIEIKELFNRGGELIGYVKKLKLWDKPKPQEMLGRNKKLFTDKVEAEHTGTIGVVDSKDVKRVMDEVENEV